MNDKMLGIFSRVRFTALGGRYERFMNECAALGIPLARVRPQAGGFAASVPARYYKKMHKPARKCQTHLRIIKKTGVWFHLRRYRGRFGLVAGGPLFLAAVVLLQNLVWDVHYVDMMRHQQVQIGEALYEAGVFEGMWMNQEQLQAAEQQLLQKAEQLGWLSLNFEKGRLVVESAPAQPMPDIEGDETIDLIAAEDGRIISTNIQEGFLLRTAGQTVSKGEVLVSTHKEDRNQIVRSAHAKGTVTALVQKTYRCEQPLVYTAQAATGKTSSHYQVRWAGGEIPIGRTAQPPAGVQVSACQRQLTLAGFALPFTLEETLWVGYDAQEFQLSQKAAREFARYACQKALWEEFPDAQVKTSEETETWGQNVFVYEWTVQFTANIAREQRVE